MTPLWRKRETVTRQVVKRFPRVSIEKLGGPQPGNKCASSVTKKEFSACIGGKYRKGLFNRQKYTQKGVQVFREWDLLKSGPGIFMWSWD